MKHALPVVLLLMSSPAQAHLGEHAGFRLMELASHLFEWDHVLFVIASILIGWAAYKAGQRSEARAALARTKSHDPR